MLNAIRIVHAAASAALTALGIVVLAGWAWDVSALKSVAAGGVTMKANAALGFALAGAALWASGFGAAPRGGRRALARILALAVAVLGGLTLVQDASGWSPGLDTALFNDVADSPLTPHPGRMAVQTAFAFLAAGSALVLLETRVAEGLVAGVLLPAVAGVLGYVYAVADLIGPFSATAMAMHTAAGFIVLGAGILAARPQRGVMAWLSSPGVEGIVARRLLLSGTLLLLTSFFVSNLGRRAGLYGQDIEDGIDAFAALVLLAALTLTCVRTLARIEAGRKRSDTALRESEARYREVVEGATIGMAIRQGSRICYANPAFLQIFGYRSAQELVGRDYFETLAAPEDRPLLLQRTAAVLRGEKLAPHPGWCGLRQDGSHVWLTASASLVDWQGAPATASFVTDITERRRAEEEILALNRDLEKRVEERTAKLASQTRDILRQSGEIARAHHTLEQHAASLSSASKYKSEFLANMSHELRTPLNSLLILSRLLADNREANLTPAQVEYAETVHQSGSDLLTLINEILDLSKIESGQMDVYVEAIPLARLRDKLERTFRPVAQSRRLDFGVAITAAVPAVIHTDANRLEQLLKNLLANALKFTEHGGVRLDVALAVAGSWGPRHPGLDEAAGVIAFAVADSGIGIAPDQQELVFEAFRQADGTTSRRYGGTGLGLSISRKIAAQLGGAIGLTSEPGEGSTFTLYLPLAHTSALPSPPPVRTLEPVVRDRPAEPAARFDKADSESARFLHGDASPPVFDDRDAIAAGDDVALLVEHDPVFAKVLLTILHRHGLKGLVAPTAAIALQLARTYQPAAITLSVTLPDMDGWKFLQRVKNDPLTRHIPVHIVSGEDERPRGLRHGAVSYLQKPVPEGSLGMLFERIRSSRGRAHSLLVVEDDLTVQRLMRLAFGEGGATHTTFVESAERGLAELQTHGFDCVVLDMRLPGMSGFEFLEAVRDVLRIDDLPIVVYTGMEPSSQQQARLHHLAESVLLKDASSMDRLLEQVTLYLHRPVSTLPPTVRATLERLLDSAHSLHGAKVLVVDDDIRNVYALIAILENAHVQVSHADNGRQCLEILQTGAAFDAVLMDIMMPEMDGFETLRRLRRMPGHAHLPVIALTAKAMRGDREDCLAAGATDYLAKPVDADQLLALLRFWRQP